MMEATLSLVREHAVLWPALLFALVTPIHLLRADRGRRSAQFTQRESRNLVLAGAAAIALFVLSVALYLSSAALVDMWESVSGSVAALFLRGEPIYPDLSTEQRYGSPYGPYLYIALGVSQLLFGASAFATKLPCVVAGLLAIALFGSVVYRRSGALGMAIVFAGFEAALLLVFRLQAFWPKADSLILLAVTIGLVAVLRTGLPWQLLLGFCLGIATGMKLHAAVYFLPLIPLAFSRGWTTRALIFAGIAGASVTMLPFLVLPGQFSIANYLALLQMAAHEGFSFEAALRFLKWAAALAALIAVGDRWQGRNEELTAQERRFRFRYRLAVAIGLALAVVPGAAIGAGPRHLMPFVPLALFDFSSHFCKATVLTAGRDRPFWRLLAYSAFAASLLAAIATTGRVFELRRSANAPLLALQAEIRRVLNSYRDATILMGAGDDDNLAVPLARQELVFAGHPIGIDTACMMDYRRAARPEPDLPKLAAELRARDDRPLVWIVPHGEPFSISNIYDGQPVFSDEFRQSFRDAFEIAERTAFFDLYVAKEDAHARASVARAD